MDYLTNTVNKIDSLTNEYEHILKDTKTGRLLCNIALLKDRLKYADSIENKKHLEELLTKEINKLNKRSN